MVEAMVEYERKLARKRKCDASEEYAPPAKRVKTEDDQISIYCSCNVFFTCYRLFATHLLTCKDTPPIEGKKGAWKCPFEGCKRTLKHKKSVAQCIMKHKHLYPFQCPVVGCIYETVSVSGVRHHMSSHSEEKKHSCTHCDKSYKSKYACQRHILSHNEVPTFPCSTCKRVYYSDRGLRNHKLTHTGTSFKCQWCPKQYDSRASLLGHLNTKHST